MLLILDLMLLSALNRWMKMRCAFDSGFDVSVCVEPLDEICCAFDSGFDVSVRVEPLDEMCRAFDSGFDAFVRVEPMDKNMPFS